MPCGFQNVSAYHEGLHPGNQFSHTAAAVGDHVDLAPFDDLRHGIHHHPNRALVRAAGDSRYAGGHRCTVGFIEIKDQIHTGDDALVHGSAAFVPDVGGDNDHAIGVALNDLAGRQRNCTAAVKEGVQTDHDCRVCNRRGFR